MGGRNSGPWTVKRLAYRSNYGARLDGLDVVALRRYERAGGFAGSARGAGAVRGAVRPAGLGVVPAIPAPRDISSHGRRNPHTQVISEDAVRHAIDAIPYATHLALAFHEGGQQGERGFCGLGRPIVLIGQVGDPAGGWRPMGLHVWSGRSRVRHDSPMPGW
jgi:hypothetical protein